MNETATVIVVGAGFAGLGAAIRLLDAGIDDVIVLESADSVGGVWRDRTHPGAVSDSPSLLFSYSFARNPGWSRSYPRGPEILDHLRDLVAAHDLSRRIRFLTTVTGMNFDAASGTWTVLTNNRGPYFARTVVLAAGRSTRPAEPMSQSDVRGVGSYRGHTMHTTRWDHDYDFTGKRVAVVGSGASVVEIVPELVRTCRSVKVFQRTPSWVLPRPDFPHPSWVRSLAGKVPFARDAARETLFWATEAAAVVTASNASAGAAATLAARSNLRLQVRDSWLRRQLTPTVAQAGILLSDSWYSSLQRDNCTLISWPIATVSPRGIRTADGIEHEVDCIVFAAEARPGSVDTPMPVVGTSGRLLDEEWHAGARACMGPSVPGFPNLFVTLGPRSWPRRDASLVHLEAQIGYVVDAVRAVVDGRIRVLDVRGDRRNGPFRRPRPCFDLRDYDVRKGYRAIRSVSASA